MQKIKIYVSSGKYFLAKEFNLRTAPQAGWNLWLFGKKILLKVGHITQDIDSDLVEVNCEADLEKLWELHTSNTGWQIRNAQAFQDDPAVKKAAEKVKLGRERIQRLVAKELK